MRRALDHVARIWAIGAFIGWIVVAAFVLGVTAPDAPAAEGDAEAAAQAPAPKLEQRRDAPQTSVEQVSRDVMCPSCDTTLDQSNSAAAERMRVWVRAAVEAGWTEDEIRDGLVQEYGGDESVLAVPRADGLGLLAWLIPAIVALAALAAGLLMVRRWRRSSTDGAVTLPDDQTRSGSSA